MPQPTTLSVQPGCQSGAKSSTGPGWSPSLMRRPSRWPPRIGLPRRPKSSSPHPRVSTDTSCGGADNIEAPPCHNTDAGAGAGRGWRDTERRRRISDARRHRSCRRRDPLRDSTTRGPRRGARPRRRLRRAGPRDAERTAPATKRRSWTPSRPARDLLDASLEAIRGCWLLWLELGYDVDEDDAGGPGGAADDAEPNYEGERDRFTSGSWHPLAQRPPSTPNRPA